MALLPLVSDFVAHSSTNQRVIMLTSSCLISLTATTILFLSLCLVKYIFVVSKNKIEEH